MYKVIKFELPELEKRVRAIGRKLDKYGMNWHFEVLGESAERVNVYRYDEVNHYQVKVGGTVLDVMSYSFDMETLKLGEWSPVAVIEHMALTDAAGTQNMVHTINNAEPLPGWWTADSKCEHCTSNRRRNKTVMLQDASGAYKQVGTSCIREFTGIDAADIISLYASVGDIYQEELRLTEERVPKSPYTGTVNYLAHCIKMISENGYNKEVTKYKAHESARTSHATPELTAQAQAIIDFYAVTDFDNDGFNNNIKTALTCEYSKISGFVAYAPIAYQKALEVIAERERKDAENAVSEWQGTPGEKITTDVEYVRSYSYESDYGRYGTTQYIHIFKDAAGNVYKWNTGKHIENAEHITITGTIKAHSEYDGQKQTVLTRCKLA